MKWRTHTLEHIFYDFEKWLPGENYITHAFTLQYYSTLYIPKHHVKYFRLLTYLTYTTHCSSSPSNTHWCIFCTYKCERIFVWMVVVMSGIFEVLWIDSLWWWSLEFRDVKFEFLNQHSVYVWLLLNDFIF